MALKSKRINFFSEIICVCIIFLQLLFVILNPKSLLNNSLPPFIINIVLYLILSMVFYFSFSAKYIIKKTDFSNLFGNKIDLDESQSVIFINKSIFHIGLVKASIMIIPVFLFIINFYKVNPFLFFRPIIIIPLLFLVFLFLFFSIKNIIKANGYLEVTNKQVISNGVFYNNPNDKRAVVEKQFGFGTTINLASKDGRIILYVLLSIPLTILILVLIILSLTGKLHF